MISPVPMILLTKWSGRADKDLTTISYETVWVMLYHFFVSILIANIRLSIMVHDSWTTEVSIYLMLVQTLKLIY